MILLSSYLYCKAIATLKKITANFDTECYPPQNIVTLAPKYGVAS